MHACSFSTIGRSAPLWRATRESLEVRLYCAACLDVWASFEQCQIKKVILCRGYQDIERKWKSGGMTIANRPENQVDSSEVEQFVYG
jgi:hypothetical protein